MTIRTLGPALLVCISVMSESSVLFAERPELAFYDSTSVSVISPPTASQPLRRWSTFSADGSSARADAYSLHDLKPIVDARDGMALQAAPRDQSGFVWHWMNFKTSLPPSTHICPYISLYRVSSKQFVEAAQATQKHLVELQGTEVWGPVRRIKDWQLKAGEFSRDFVGDGYECIDTIAWPIFRFAPILSARSIEEWRNSFSMDINVKSATEIEAVVITKDSSDNDSPATLHRFSGQFSAVRYGELSENPSWRGEWKLVQTAKITFCGQFIVAGGGESFQILTANYRPLAVKRVVGLDSTKYTFVREDDESLRMKVVLMGKSPSDPVFAFSETKWFKVTPEYETHDFELGEFNKESPMPTFRHCFREIQKHHNVVELGSNPPVQK